ncbi:hypothetical protein BBJ28_00018405 [Nothophytophthora sp. Chile5]|nr:hypothetical protein BBJ28_00018405 [Nothophytophthora sp. Chile5]
MAPLDYRWAHAVNSPALLSAVQQQVRDAQKLQFASADFVNAVEADIIWSEAKQAPVMGHPPQTDGDLTFASFLDAMRDLSALFQTSPTATATPLIVKCDFKSSQAFEKSYDLLAKFTASFPFADGIFINADILPGPANTNDVAFNAAEFLQQANALSELDGGKHSHKLVLSVGWTTANATEEEIRREYSAAMVDDMLRVLQPYTDKLAVTFPLRATSVRKSWRALRPLLGPANFGFTLWWAKSQMSDLELEWLYSTLELETHTVEQLAGVGSGVNTFADRTFYDILGFDQFLKKRANLQASPPSMLQN